MQGGGLVRAGHISLDGTKVKANASKHKAMSYVRMNEREEQLRREIDDLLKRADKTDTEEDSRYGRGNRNDDVPRELAFREERLRKIRQARATLEKRVREEKDKNDPSPKDQTNFTDPASRIMKDSATKEFIQGYNAQCAVDDTVQVIVAAGVTTEANDKRQVEPMIVMIEENLGCPPKELSADAGYFSEENITHLHARGIRALIPRDRMKHTDTVPLSSRGRIPKDLSVKDRMRRLLRTKKGRSSYVKRKTIVEPVFGQIKEVRGLRRFLLLGLEKVTAEWQLICLTHKLLKLYRWKVAKIPV